MAAWSHRVLLNAVDITADTLLGVVVEESESASHLCDLTYYPASGTQDSDGLMLQTLQVDVDVGSGWETLHNGKVVSAIWSTKGRAYRITSSNRLQEHFRALATEAAVESALTGSVYSNALLGEPADDLWEHAQRCMETIETDVHLDRAGSLALVSWAAKGTADHALTSADVHNDGAFEIERPDADELINEVIVEYEYRVQRWKVRSHTLTWSAWSNNVGIASWCEWAIGTETQYQFVLPMLPLLDQSMGGGSWNVPAGVSFTTHPPSGSNLCNVNGWVWVNNEPEGREIAVTRGSAVGYRAWAQPIWETYTLTVSAENAKTLYGATVTERKTGSYDVPSDDSWPPDKALPQDTWTTDAIGDKIDDQDDETARAADLQCGYQWGKARIRRAQRATTLVVRTDLRPDITLADTVSVACYGLTAKGKARRIRYVLDAAPYTELGIAISRGNGGTTDTWSVPSRPSSAPTHTAPASSQSYQTYVGAWSGAAAAPDPDERLGWVTNVSENATGYNPLAEVYDPAFRVEWPEVEDEAAEEVTASYSATYEIAVDHDTLTIT